MRSSTLIALGAILVAACSSSTPTSGIPSGAATLALVNGLAGGYGAQVTLDQSPVALPGAGKTSQLSISAGAHQIDISSSTGRHYSTLAFSVGPDSSRTVVISGGADTAAVSVTTDTVITVPVPNTGQILLVNSAPGVGPFDVYVYRANSDSTLHFGSFSFGAGTPQSTSPYRYLFPFNPGSYTFVVTNPGSTTALATTVVTLAARDVWTVVLATSVEGGLVLTATKN